MKLEFFFHALANAEQKPTGLNKVGQADFAFQLTLRAEPLFSLFASSFITN